MSKSMTDTLTYRASLRLPNPLSPLRPRRHCPTLCAHGPGPELIQATTDLGYTQPTQVQNQVIPLALPAVVQGNEPQRLST